MLGATVQNLVIWLTWDLFNSILYSYTLRPHWLSVIKYNPYFGV